VLPKLPPIARKLGARRMPEVIFSLFVAKRRSRWSARKSFKEAFGAGRKLVVFSGRTKAAGRRPNHFFLSRRQNLGPPKAEYRRLQQGIVPDSRTERGYGQRNVAVVVPRGPVISRWLKKSGSSPREAMGNRVKLLPLLWTLGGAGFTDCSQSERD